MCLLYGTNWIFVYISGLFSPLKDDKKVEIGYAVLYFQQSVLPFMVIHCNCKPNVAKMIVLQGTYYVEIISLRILLNICRLVTLVDYSEVYIFVMYPVLV
jgi:uncharacterized protein (UPF0548 family)